MEKSWEQKWKWGGHLRDYSSTRENILSAWHSGHGNVEMQLNLRESLNQKDPVID